MTEVLFFPKLDLVFNLSKIAFSVGPINVYWYGILITIGFVLAVGYLVLMSPKFKINLDDVFDVIVYSVIGAIVGARVYYVVFNFELYKDKLIDVFKIWEGGIAIYGGIIGAFCVAIAMLKKRKVKIWPCLDLAVGGLLLGQAIGRWGNFVNIEAFGSNTDTVFGMTSRSIQNYLFGVAPKLAKEGIIIDPLKNVHPCFLYESIWCLLGFVVLNIIIFKFNYIRDFENSENSEIQNNTQINKHNIYPGELTLIYFIWYSTGRFAIEGLRVDSLMLGNFRVSQILSLILVIGSLLAFVFLRLKRRNKDNKQREEINQTE